VSGAAPDAAASGAAERVFDEHCARLERGEPSDLEALCAAHPALAAELRALDAHWRRWMGAVERLADLAPRTTPRDEALEALLVDLARHPPRASRFQAGEELGRGGMGTVLRVRDADLKRDMAKKVLLRRDDAGALRRFLAEAQITAQLDHPGVVAVHDLGVDEEGRPWFTMRLVAGDDLGRIFGRVERGEEGWTLARAVGVLLRVCETMAYAHSKGVIHRDLKPSNIMVGPWGEVQVMDWGLAKVAGRTDPHDLRLRSDGSRLEADEHGDDALATMDGVVLGTPAYMPPEQANGKWSLIGPRSDEYSVGAMLHHLLAGRPPYQFAGAHLGARAILERVRAGPPESLAASAPHAPPELVAICERAMRRDPELRYPGMAELGEDLRAWLEGRVVKAHETGTWAETRKWVRRNRGLAAALALVVVSLAVGVVVSTRFADEARSRARQLRVQSMEQELERLAAWTADWRVGRRLGAGAREEWIREARLLVHGRDGSGVEWHPGIEDVRSALRDLRAKALPWSVEDRERDAATAAAAAKEQASADAARDTLAWSEEILAAKVLHARRQLGLAPWPTRAEALAELAFTVHGDNPAQLEARARMWLGLAVGSDHRSNATHRHGSEYKALVLIERVREQRGGEPTLDSLLLEAQARTVLMQHDEARRLLRAAAAASDGEQLRRIEAAQAALEAEALRWIPEALEQRRAELRALEGELARLRADLAQRGLPSEPAEPERRTWRFDDLDEQWVHDSLARTIAALELLEVKLAAAEAASTPEAARAWRTAIDAIATHPAYMRARWPGGRLSPQLGLVPLGPDPRSGLHEFAHLHSGTKPPRGADGLLELRPEHGVVFVLVPGGVPYLDARNSLAELHATLDLEPYFLAKHELTQAQWNRLAGAGREHADPGPMHPANNASWVDCKRLFERTLGWMCLPTDAQWEHACRAGTTSAWWTGDSEETLVGAANCAFGGESRLLARVDAARPNAWGFHDMHGNAWEWCRDTLSGKSSLPDDGLIDHDKDGQFDRSFRGGSCVNSPGMARSSMRFSYAPTRRLPTLGLRPAIAVMP
jgi:hypothetical protein